jgi:hypothetical protein
LANLLGQCGHSIGKTGSDLLVGQFASLEAGVALWNWKLEIEYSRAQRGQDFAELSLRPGPAEGADARTDHGHRLVPQHVRRDRAQKTKTSA